MSLPSGIMIFLRSLLNRIAPVFAGSAVGSSLFGTSGLVAGSAVGVLATLLFDASLLTSSGIALLGAICIQLLMNMGVTYERASEFARLLRNLIRTSTGMNNEVSYTRELHRAS